MQTLLTQFKPLLGRDGNRYERRRANEPVAGNLQHEAEEHLAATQRFAADLGSAAR